MFVSSSSAATWLLAPRPRCRDMLTLRAATTCLRTPSGYDRLEPLDGLSDPLEPRVAPAGFRGEA